MNFADQPSLDCLGCDGPEPEVGNYFVSAYPPFSSWNKDQLEAAERAVHTQRCLPAEVPLGLYVHIPFCAERCHYCYYRSYAKTSVAQIDQYLEAILSELAQYASAPSILGRNLDFVYFGGGTPSLLSATQIRRLLSGIQELFPKSSPREITFECGPKSVTADRLDVLHDAGVTRLSMGVQQLDDEVLSKSGRVHRVADVERAWSVIETAGFPVTNLDLMVGLVGETDPSFFGSLRRVMHMAPTSITIYLLEIPRNTPLFHNLPTLEAAPAAWDVKRDRLAAAFQELEQHGYLVRSAYAAVRDAKAGRFIYQEAQYHGADLVGVGVASFSYLHGVHFQNHVSIERYLQSLQSGESPRARAYALTREEQAVREFVLQLKLGDVSRADFETKFGVILEQYFARPLEECAQRGWLTIDQTGVRLSRTGLLRVDRLLPAFYLPQHRECLYW